jgi:hypothetical protein
VDQVKLNNLGMNLGKRICSYNAMIPYSGCCWVLANGLMDVCRPKYAMVYTLEPFSLATQIYRYYEKTTVYSVDL